MTERFPFSKLPHAYARQSLLRDGGPTKASVYLVHLQESPGNWRSYNLSVEKIKAFTGLSDSPIRKANAWLRKMKVIDMTSRVFASGQKMNEWQLLPPKMWAVKTTFDVTGLSLGIGAPLFPETGGPCPQEQGLYKIRTLQDKITTTTTNSPILKRRIIQEEYETVPHNLEDVVVAILKKLKVDQSFWPQLQDMDPNRVKALSDLANKKAKTNPGGWFRKAVEDKWLIPGFDKAAFEMQCDLIRSTATHLKSKKTGKEYEIIKFQTGDRLVISTDDRGEVVLDSEKKLEDFTWSA